MDFFKRHFPTFLQNTAANIAAVVVITLALACFDSVRAPIHSLIMALVPMWAALIAMAGTGLLVGIYIQKNAYHAKAEQTVMGTEEERSVTELGEDETDVDPDVTGWMKDQELDRQTETIKQQNRELNHQRQRISDLERWFRENNRQAPPEKPYPPEPIL